MEFSESLDFGNSTFMKLENLMKGDVNGSQCKSRERSIDSPDPPPPVDIITESPTETKSSFSRTRTFVVDKINKTQNALQRHKFQTTKNVPSRSKFSKSKSDSSLDCDNHNPVLQIDNYSAFFRSDFPIEEHHDEEVQLVKTEPSDVMRISQIQAALDNTTSDGHQICEGSVLDTALFSEDFNVVLQEEDEEGQQNTEKQTSYKEKEQAENEWQDSLLLSNKEDRKEEEEEVDERIDTLPQIDETSFITSGREEAQRISALELKRSKCTVDQVFEEAYHPLKKKKKKSNNAVVSAGSPSSSMRYLNEISKTSVNQSHSENAETGVDILGDNREALKQISAWHLPLSVQREYEKKGICTMFDWQIECLSNPKVLFEHKNLVYSAPTSAGKTLISEILLIKTVVERSKKVLLILPFISVVREKMFYLQDLLLPSGYRVEGFFGGYSPPVGFESINVAICTIEKANTIVNKLLEQKKLADIGLIIVDEVHLISDPGRGYILELLLAKVLYMCRQFGFQIQIITMSATLANVTLLQRWLQAECYITHFRPVALQEMIKVGSKIYDKDMKLLRELNTADGGFEVLQNDAEHVAQLCIETLDASCSVLVFCPSKDWCEKLALQLAGAIYSVGKGSGELGNRLRAQLNREAINELKRQLKELPTGLDSILERTTTYGCAFHHAGLTTEERDLVEASFKSGALKVIVATSTLSSGVNLPARRVLIRSPLFGGKQMNALTYRQMIGRAGRTGKDTVGESILLCTEGNARSGRELITADLKPITSCLEMENSAHLKRALLEVISSGVASTKEDIEQFVSCTLLHTEKDIPDSREEAINREKDKPRAEAVSQCISESIEFLLEYEFIRLQSPNEDRLNMNMDMYVATRLGLACLASSMPPSDGLLLFAELQKSRRCFVLESDLHAVYLVTPYSVCYQLQDMDWLFFLDLWEKLKPAMKKVGEIVGVKESFLVRAMRGQSNLDYKLLQIHKRFYIALALQELVNETPINQVAVKYRCTRGLLQSLQQMSSTFAGIVTAFCNSLNWSTLALVVSQFKERLFFGVHHDLIDLMRLPELNQKRARALFDADITNLVQLANADVAAVEKILYNSLCFDSAKQQENENAYDAERRISERILFITGRKGLTVSEAASMLIQDARVFVQYDIGVENIHWNKVESEASMESECGDRREAKKATEEKENLACEDNIKLKQIKRKCPQEGRRRLLMSNADDEQKNEEVTDTKLLKKSAMDLVKSKNTEKCNEKYKKLEKAQNNLPINQKHWTNISQTSSHPERPDNQQNPKVTKNAEKVNRTELLTKSIDNQEALVSTVTSMDIKKTKIPPLIHDRIPSNIKKEQHSEKSQNNIEKNLKEKTHFSTPKLQGKKDFVEETTVLLSKERFKDESQATPSGGAFMKTVPRRSPRNHIVSSTRIETVPNALLNKGKPLEKADMSTPTGNSFMKTKPRRGPRNHIVSSTRLAKMMPNGGGDGDDDGGDKRISKKEEPEIFADDDYSDSFRMNTDIADALKIADEMLDSHTPCPTMDNHLNKSNDEIPSSQQCDNDDVHTQTPQKSRFLRSYRVKNRASPKPAQQEQQQKHGPHDIITVSSKNQQDSLALPLHHYDVTNDPSISTKSEDRIELSDVSMENSLMLNPQYLNASHILSCSKTDSDVGASSFKSIEIIDMCSKQKLFKEAFKELNAARRIGLSLGLQKDVNKRTPLIGSNLLITEVTEKQTAVKETVQFALDDTSSSYLAGIAFSLDKNIVYFMNMQDEGTCAGLTKELKCKYLCLLFKSTQCTFLIHDTKEQLKCLRKVLRETATAGDISLEDPKVANWLLQPDNNLSFADLTQQFAPECTALVKLCGTARGFGSVGLDADNAIFAKVRCSIEACVTSYILRGQIENLERIGSGQLMKFFKELEMPLQLSLCNMELYGFPANASELRKLFQQMVETLKKVEVKIYDMHGSRFNLTSTAAVAKVLGLHRKSNGRVSTSRQILEKIASPISQLIITHRKLSATITKNIQPLLKCITGDRIHGQSITFTATGRISMTEPNLQNVAKDFQVELGAKEKITISCRGAFSPTDAKRCLIASDFCQLEMRILAHLSQDATLLEVLNSETDVFIALAARWNKISEDEVSEPLRNGTKQICYGIVYGMGIRSLAEALKCTEEEAANVSQQFHAAYPGIKIFTERVVKFAHTNGYIETITGRRRYLQHINSSESNIRKQAERQAINSTIQGSAADIAKSAVIRMEKNIIKYSKKLGIDPTSNVHLVLHLHDELIYEVPTEKAKKIAKVLSVTMENCVKLSVPLRVKLKIGKTWGDLKEVKL